MLPFEDAGAFHVERYEPDGALDLSFGSAGAVTSNLSPRSHRASAVALQPDGKIVIAGTADIGILEDFALVRYHPDGTLDAEFGVGGVVTTP